MPFMYLKTDYCLSDLCVPLENAVDEMFNILEEKVCEIEEAKADLPYLALYDEFVLQSCGGYCIASCHVSFPVSILEEWVKCIDYDWRRRTNTRTSSRNRMDFSRNSWNSVQNDYDIQVQVI